MTQRLVIIGGDAGGMTAISQVRRLSPDTEIVALERGQWTSYSACGIPFVLSGEVDEVESLVARSHHEHRSRHGIDLRMGHEAVALDLGARSVQVRDHGEARTYHLGFDQLLIGTGALPVLPPVPGIDLPHVHVARTLDDALRLQPLAAAAADTDAVVVGGGYLGIELAEALVMQGARVTLIDHNDEVMTSLDPDMGTLVAKALRDGGVQVWTGTDVDAVEPDVVHTTNGRAPASLVLLATGVRPNVALAAVAGIELGIAGSITVDRRQSTSVEGVWAAGDCCGTVHRVSGAPAWMALGTHANKQSRVAGINIGGGYATFPGVLGTAITKFCDTEIARTGFTQLEATEAGFAHTVATIEATTVAGYYPGAAPMTVRMVVEQGTGRLLGAQIVGGPGAGKRIDTCATALAARMTVAEILDLDLAYAPPFSGVWDPVLVAARRAIGAS